MTAGHVHSIRALTLAQQWGGLRDVYPEGDKIHGQYALASTTDDQK